MARATSDEISYATQVGNRTELPNGDTIHVARHEHNPDYVIRVRTRRGVAMESSVSHNPISKVVQSRKKEEGEAKAKADRSAANRAAQLAKKRKRTPPPPPNKQKKK